MTEKHLMGGIGKWKDEIIAVLLLMGFAFFINRGIEIKGLYMDDLYLWSCYGEQSFGQFIFPMGSTRFRFLYYLAAWLELAIIGNHIGWFVPLNIILNGCIAYTVYRFGRRLARNWAVGLGCGLLYLASRMSYYQIGQVYGLMESLALWAALGILYCLLCYTEEKEDGRKYFIWANVLYFAICFIHERYLVLLPLLYLAVFWKKGRKRAAFLVPAAVFAAVMAIRVVTIGSVAPAGTGGTNVADTFDVRTALGYAVDQVLYIFGINAGPGHLSGMSWQESPVWIHIQVLAADLALALLVVLAINRIIRDKEGRLRCLREISLFLTFIALCIGASSVTIRVETRWIYVSMTAAYLLAAYFFGIITARASHGKVIDIKRELRKAMEKKAGRQSAVLCGGLLVFYLIVMAPVEVFYRGQYPNLYFWADQQRYNSLAEETYEKYGDEIFGREIYIIGTSYNMSDFTARTFFKEFDRDRKAEGTTVHFIDSIHEIGLITNNMLVLREDPAHNGFQDVTDFVRTLKCEAVYGYYRDGWMDESAEVRVMTGKSGVISMEIYYPGQLTGSEVSVISLNGETVKEVVINQNTMRVELEAEPYQIANLQFENNFYLKDAGEQRGEKRFSMIVNFTAD